MRVQVTCGLSRQLLCSGVGLAACILVLGFAAAPASGAESEIKLLQYGTWGLSIDRDPVKQKFPAVVYVPPGTIVFSSKPGPLQNHVSVQLHYGHWVQIEKTLSIKGKPVNVLTPIDGLVEPPPSDTIMVHRSIFCLGQTNRILPPREQGCDQVGDNPDTTVPVGKGWIYKFRPSSKPEWLDLIVRLDEATKTELTKKGLTSQEANFEVTRNDLLKLERQGYLTILDKKYPRAIFEYQNRRPVYIECGQNKVTEKALKGSAKLKAEGGVGFEAPFWAKLVSGLQARLGLQVEGEATAEAGTTWTITVDTNKASY